MAGGVPPQRRFPNSVYGLGAEPDARFSLANERTFLAWIRTALALIAAGVALEAFALPIEPTFRLIAALVLIGLGILAPVQAWVGWMSTEKALRLGRLLPAPHLAGPIGLGVAVAGVLVVLGLLLP
jgi:putative membrane protein